MLINLLQFAGWLILFVGTMFITAYAVDEFNARRSNKKAVEKANAAMRAIGLSNEPIKMVDVYNLFKGKKAKFKSGGICCVDSVSNEYEKFELDESRFFETDKTKWFKMSNGEVPGIEGKYECRLPGGGVFQQYYNVETNEWFEIEWDDPKGKSWLISDAQNVEWRGFKEQQE